MCQGSMGHVSTFMPLEHFMPLYPCPGRLPYFILGSEANSENS